MQPKEPRPPVFFHCRKPQYFRQYFLHWLSHLIWPWNAKKKELSGQGSLLYAFRSNGLSLIPCCQEGPASRGGCHVCFLLLAVNPKMASDLVCRRQPGSFDSSVLNRIQYLLSPQYLISSLTGADWWDIRFGIDMFRRNFWVWVKNLLTLRRSSHEQPWSYTWHFLYG